MLCPAHTVLLGYQNTKNETDGAFVMLGGESHRGFKETDDLQNFGVEGRITLKWIVRIGMGKRGQD